MRQNLYISGSAVPKLRGNVEHALKVVAGPDIMDQLPAGTFLPQPAVSGFHSSQTANGMTQHQANPTVGLRVVPHAPAGQPNMNVGGGCWPYLNANSGCWPYQSIDGVPLVMERTYPYANPNLAAPAAPCRAACQGGCHPHHQHAPCRTGCPAAPAVPGYGSLEEWLRYQDAPRRGVLREDHVPVGPEPDLRVAWQSGFMPVDTSFIRQVIPPWVSAYGRSPFNCGPCPNVGGASATVSGSPVVRLTNGQIVVG